MATTKKPTGAKAGKTAAKKPTTKLVSKEQPVVAKREVMIIPMLGKHAELLKKGTLNRIVKFTKAGEFGDSNIVDDGQNVTMTAEGGTINLKIGATLYALLQTTGAFRINDGWTNKTNHLSILGGTNGAGIELIGDGASTPKKYIRATGGSLQVVNDAYGAIILSLNDTGVLNLPVSTGRVLIAGTQVVGPRDTGWVAMTGTANENTVYDTATVTLAQLAGRVMALQAALTTHGLLGA